MARLYSNENFPLAVVQELRRLGHDVLTIQETGKAEQAVPDDEVLRFAVSEDRILLTLNRKDFIQLHGRYPEHAGIVVCTVDVDFPGQAHRIHAALAEVVEVAGQLIRVRRENRKS